MKWFSRDELKAEIKNFCLKVLHVIQIYFSVIERILAKFTTVNYGSFMREFFYQFFFFISEKII